MKTYLKLLITAAILIAAFVSNSVLAKSLNAGKSGGHEADIYAVLPFAHCTEVSSLIKTIHQNIDHPIGYFEGLRDAPHEDFTWHKLGHRVFFHWGFNVDPRQSIQLAALITERGWNKTIEDQFWAKVVAEQARRNRQTMVAIGSTLGFELSGTERAYANAYASIITDVHILGDYSTINIVTLQTLDMVVADLKKALFESLKGGDEAKKINKMLDATHSSGDIGERAESILSVLKTELPRFLLTIQDGGFKKRFVAKGLPLKQTT